MEVPQLQQHRGQTQGGARVQSGQLVGPAETICNAGAAQQQAQVISPGGCDRTGYHSLFKYGIVHF